MTTSMGPPPPKNPAASAEPSTSGSTNASAVAPPLPNEPEPAVVPSEDLQQEVELNPPSSDAPENPIQVSNSGGNSSNGTSAKSQSIQEQSNTNLAVPYEIPPWSAPPGHEFFLEVLKDGSIINRCDVNEKGAYTFGRVDICDFVLEHPTISRFHAVLQFKSDGGAYLYDLGSTHGTFMNKNQVKKRIYVDLHVGDVIRFGHSTRLYIFQGPSELMLPEADLKSLRKAKNQQERQDMEASLLRAKIEASRADGISWGMGEDAVEEFEDEVEEITWQTYKGQLTDKQEKTREKVIKRLEKISHMKKEIDAIRAKDISQGGLTQGQQTQIARNEQRISQLMEELENLEETLNESIRESLGARAGNASLGKKKGYTEEDEDYISDDDEFYDRTQKSLKPKCGENQSVETADSLLDKKDALIKEIEEKEKSLVDEEKPAEIDKVSEAGDALDAYMSAVSTQLVLDNKEKIKKELSTLKSELDRILYLLRISDPTGEAVRKRESREQKPLAVVEKSAPEKKSPKIAIKPEKNNKIAVAPEKNKKTTVAPENSKPFEPEASSVISMEEKATIEAKSEPVVARNEPESTSDQSTATVFTVAKPQWLGAVDDRKKPEASTLEPAEVQETDKFVDYKDRASILNEADSVGGIENAAPGLIIRKRKQVVESKVSDATDSETTTASHFKAEDAVALLLKHSKGYHAAGEEDQSMSTSETNEKCGKKQKRVLGPERPAFLEEPDYSSWVPPEGQSGDGRTSLNERLGY